MKRWISVLVLVAIGLVIWYGATYLSKPAPVVDDELQGDVTALGVVLEVDTSQAPVDGPIVVVVQDSAGVTNRISLPTMSLVLCPAYTANHILDVYQLRPGELVEVRGRALTDGSIEPCNSAEHYLRSLGIVEDDFEGEADPNRMTLEMKPWVWVRSYDAQGAVTLPRTPGVFTVTFGGHGALAVTTDCNTAGGTYIVGEQAALSLINMYATKKYCAASQEQVFLGGLEQTQSYQFTSRGELVLKLGEQGSIWFR